MSKVTISGNASGTGVFTIAAPNSNTDRVLTLPDEAGTVLTSASDLSGATGMYADSDVKTLFDVSGSCPMFAVRAWAMFNGTGTPAFFDSGNCSSISDLGTGQYQVNFTTAMDSGTGNYAAISGTVGAGGYYFISRTIDKTPAKVGIDISNGSSYVDSSQINLVCVE